MAPRRRTLPRPPRGGARTQRLTRAARAVPAWFWTDAALPFVATRLALTIVGVSAALILPLSPDPTLVHQSTSPWIDVWSRWDGGWYVSIAREGYSYAPGEQSTVAFSPLYPLLMRALMLVTGRGGSAAAAAAGIVVSNLALLAACVLLIRYVGLDRDAATAARAAKALLVFPTSLFFSAVYPESLFLMLAIAALLAARHERWWTAGALGGLAALTRPFGAILLLPLALEYVASRGLGRRLLSPGALGLALVPLGYLGWAAYLYTLSGDPWLVLRASSAPGWDRQFAPPWESIANALSGPLLVHGSKHSLFDLAFTAVFVVLTLATWRLLRPAAAVYATALLLVILSTGGLYSVMRWALAIFPVFIVLAVAGRSRWFDEAYTVLAVALGAFLMVLFALSYWVA